MRSHNQSRHFTLFITTLKRSVSKPLCANIFKNSYLKSRPRLTTILLLKIAKHKITINNIELAPAWSE